VTGWRSSGASSEAFPDAQWRDARHFFVGDRGLCDAFTFREGEIAVKNSHRKQRS